MRGRAGRGEIWLKSNPRYAAPNERRDRRRQRKHRGTTMKLVLGVAIAAAIAMAALSVPAFAQSVSGENTGASAANAMSARQAQAAALGKLQAHGEELFNQRCKSCHMPPVEHAPSRSELAAQFPNVIADALKTGKMQAMAAGLSD